MSGEEEREEVTKVDNEGQDMVVGLVAGMNGDNKVGSEKNTVDSLTVNVEEPKAGAQLENKVDITADKARNGNFGKFSGDEASPEVPKVDSNDLIKVVGKINYDNKAGLEENTDEEDEVDDQEDILWEDEENSEHDNEERLVDEYEVSEEEDDVEDDEDDEVSEEEGAEEEEEDEEEEDEVSEEENEENKPEENEENKPEENEENKPEEKETAKRDAGKAKVKEYGTEAEEQNAGKLDVSLKNSKKSSERSTKKKVRVDKWKKLVATDKPESSRKRKVKKRVESMGMIFMCSSKTKNDCYQYRVLGLPESKKDIVEKIYTGMRLFLYDVDLKLMYGIYKAAGPGGYNIEPKAFKSQFPSQVRFKVLNDCLPIPEEKFKKIIKNNYFTKTKFDCQLNSEQVKKLCKLFIASRKGLPLKTLGKNHKAEKRPERTRKRRPGDKRRLPLREDVNHHERPRKRPRKVISPAPPRRQRLPASPRRQRLPAPPRRQRSPAPLPSNVPPSYVYERTSSVDPYPYLKRHSPYGDKHDQLLSRSDPYGDLRAPPIERNDVYRDGRDPHREHHYAYRDGQGPYIVRRDPYRDVQDSYTRRHDLYRDGRDTYIEPRDLYRDVQDPYIVRHDSSRDRRDSYLDRRVPYTDDTHSERYSIYRRDPLSDRRDYREDQGLEYRESYRRDELLEARDLRPYAEPLYSAEYPARTGLARSYRL